MQKAYFLSSVRTWFHVCKRLICMIQPCFCLQEMSVLSAFAAAPETSFPALTIFSKLRVYDSCQHATNRLKVPQSTQAHGWHLLSTRCLLRDINRILLYRTFSCAWVYQQAFFLFLDSSLSEWDCSFSSLILRNNPKFRNRSENSSLKLFWDKSFPSSYTNPNKLCQMPHHALQWKGAALDLAKLLQVSLMAQTFSSCHFLLHMQGVVFNTIRVS